MKKKTKLLTILFFTLMIASTGFIKLAHADCIISYDSDGAASELCW